ncbi:hypothetical protein [Sporichthya polymorpha]|uniref:hypothetical protein n=1 Tax=Sporichthya polymorpha TaxID=35751 RepID=UPI0012EC3A3F|nr:hypothetical protein [Sporichthya polymorpha]
MHRVDVGNDVQEQIDALPVEALNAFAELRVVLQTAPWSGRPSNPDNPNGAVRLYVFAGAGLARYLVSEHHGLGELIDGGRWGGDPAATSSGQEPHAELSTPEDEPVAVTEARRYPPS